MKRDLLNREVKETKEFIFVREELKKTKYVLDTYFDIYEDSQNAFYCCLRYISDYLLKLYDRVIERNSKILIRRFVFNFIDDHYSDYYMERFFPVDLITFVYEVKDLFIEEDWF